MILAIQKCAFIVSTKGKAVFVDVEMCREASKMVPFTKVQYFYAKEKEIESYVFYSQQSANVCCGVEFLEIPFGAQLRW